MATGVATSFMFLLILLLPLVAGIAMIVMSRRKGKGYPACGKCGYDVSGTLGTTTARCPECGGDFAVVGITPPMTQVRRWPLVVGVALLVIPITCVGGSILMARASYSRAAQTAQAAAARQAAIAQQQVMLASMKPDPVLVTTYRARVASLTDVEAANRISAITQELAKRQVDQTLTEDIAGNLTAELQALSEHLSSQPPNR